MHLISLKTKVRLLEGDRGSAARSLGGGICPKMGSSLMNRVERWAGLWLASVLCAGAMAGTAPLCNAQSTTTQSKKPAAKKKVAKKSKPKVGLSLMAKASAARKVTPIRL